MEDMTGAVYHDCICLGNGIQPGKFLFNHDSVRRHLFKCLTDRREDVDFSCMLVKPEARFDCICHNMPEIPPMVECSQCITCVDAGIVLGDYLLQDCMTVLGLPEFHARYTTGLWQAKVA